MEEAPACATRCSSRTSPAHLLHAAEVPVQARARIPFVACVCVWQPGPPLPREPLHDHQPQVDLHLGREVEAVEAAVRRRRRRSRTKT